MNEFNNFTLKKRAKTFYFASLFFPKEIRTDIETLYLFCRYVDDIGDTLNLKKRVTEDKLKRIIVDIDKLNSDELIISKLILLIKRYKINKRIPIKLVEGILDDLGKVSFNTESELIEYSYKVAGTVGIMVCNIFQVKEKELKFKGIQLGIAMQITNIARDIEEDLLRNRIYFPEDLRSLKIKKIEMHFLAPVYVKCEVCDGKRYNKETLAVQYKSKNISDILNMTVDDACEFFSSNPQVFSKLKTLNDVGLGYISIGQAATTLSGGEAQRIKLSKELSKRQTGKTLYILDEPTTGLHFDDIKKLLEILHKLVSYGNTVIVIEHNLDVVNTSDWIIDLGPEGGEKGGQILFEGLPKDIIKRKENQTGIYLKKYQESLALSTAS